MILIPTRFREGPVEAFLGGASPEPFSGGGQLKKTPCSLLHFPIVQDAVGQGVAAVEGGAAGFAAANCASSPGDMQVKIITYTEFSFSYIYCRCNVNSSSIPQI